MGLCLSRQTQQVAVGVPSDSNNLRAETDKPKANEATTQKTALICSYLDKVPVLTSLSEADRSLVASELVEKRYDVGQAIVTEGDPGNEFFIIQSGSASVEKRDPQGGDPIKVATLTDGDYFGETALINNAKRAATVAAMTTTVCLALDGDAFNRMFGKSKLNVQFAKRNAISAEQLRQHTSLRSAGGSFSERVFEKPPETTQQIAKALSSNVLFSALDWSQVKQIVDEMHQKIVPKDTMIIKQGDHGDYFYVVDSGTFECSIENEQGVSNVVATLGPGTSFGELALLYNSPRAASVVAKTDSVLWAVKRTTFRRILMKVNDEKRCEYESFLKSVPMLSALTASERSLAAESLEEVCFVDKTRIVQEGTPGETFFVILHGNVNVTKAPVEGQEGKAPMLVQRLGRGDFFGERALLKEEPRAATVTADGPVTCLSLDRQAFGIVLGPLNEIMQRNIDKYKAEPMELPKEDLPSDSKIIKDLQMSDLQIIGTLGKGSFGHVQLVKLVRTGETFAMKKVSKAQIVHLGQQEHIMSEKRVMAQMNHPFLIQLRGTLKDQDHLYFIIELCLGGELFSVLRARVQFDEDTARFYAASVVLAFEYMHAREIIYRDLKPENLLLDTEGFLKITDFGFAKFVPDRTWTLCGTPDYLAPEVISGQGHGKAVDWWTLGILMYEMLVSYPPFYDSDPMRTYAKIMQGRISFPRHVGKDAVDLIQRLLHPKATKRLGAVKGSSIIIKKHPWFKGFDWEGLVLQTLKVPIVPQVANNMDLANFEGYPHEEDDTTPYKEDGSHWDADF